LPQIIPGAEPFAFGEGSQAILFLHGWTSSPRELRFLAEKIAPLGFHCQGLLLQGHGLTLEDLSPTRFSDYLVQSLQAFDDLAAKYATVSICGLSMGGLLGLYIALERKVADLVLIAPFLRPWGKTMGLPNDWLVGRIPLWGNIAKSQAGPIKNLEEAKKHIAYRAMPAAAMVSVVEAARKFRGLEPKIACPVLIHHALQDTTSDFSGSLGLIERVKSLDRILMVYSQSNHVLTLDYDRIKIETETYSWYSRHRLTKPS
jgi:carboxylesterase